MDTILAVSLRPAKTFLSVSDFGYAFKRSTRAITAWITDGALFERFVALIRKKRTNGQKT